MVILVEHCGSDFIQLGGLLGCAFKQLVGNYLSQKFIAVSIEVYTIHRD